MRPNCCPYNACPSRTTRKSWPSAGTCLRGFSHNARRPQSTGVRRNDVAFVRRSNASVEIWDVSHRPHVDRTLICDSSVEGLGWFRGRLFSCSANGTVTEHDLHSLSPLVSERTAAGHRTHTHSIVYRFCFIFPVLQDCDVRIVLVHSDTQGHRTFGRECLVSACVCVFGFSSLNGYFFRPALKTDILTYSK